VGIYLSCMRARANNNKVHSPMQVEVARDETILEKNIENKSESISCSSSSNNICNKSDLKVLGLIYDAIK
jgi:hypothetical protein